MIVTISSKKNCSPATGYLLDNPAKKSGARYRARNSCKSIDYYFDALLGRSQTADTANCSFSEQNNLTVDVNATFSVRASERLNHMLMVSIKTKTVIVRLLCFNVCSRL